MYKSGRTDGQATTCLRRKLAAEMDMDPVHLYDEVHNHPNGCGTLGGGWVVGWTTTHLPPGRPSAGALGRVLAFDAAAREFDLGILMRNDTVRALAALQKGCSWSTFLQQCSMRLAMLHREALCHPLCLHAPGDKLILEGVDSLSRDIVAEIRSVRASQQPAGS